MPDKKSVKIIGGGLAGLALGIRLRGRHIPVAVHEAGSYPRNRVCGEFINGISRDTLLALGIEDCLKDSISNTTTAWFAGDTEILYRTLPEPAIGLSRYRMDEALARQFVELGGELHERSRYRKTNGGSGTVWATGRQQDVASDWLGLKCHITDLELCADLEMHLGEDGYLGISRIENGRYNVCGLFKTRSQISAAREKLLPAYLKKCGLQLLAERIEQAPLVAGSPVGVSAFRLGAQQEKGNELRIGDRFAIVGPFTGNGMSMAFEGAAIADETLSRWSEGDLDWRTTVSLANDQLSDAFSKRLKLSGFLHPFLMNGWRRQLLVGLSRTGMIPFNSLFHRLR